VGDVISTIHSGETNMKSSLAALAAACAVYSAAFGATMLDNPPLTPPHVAALDNPPLTPPHNA
jgi:hypothetical protein